MGRYSGGQEQRFDVIDRVELGATLGARQRAPRSYAPVEPVGPRRLGGTRGGWPGNRRGCCVELSPEADQVLAPARRFTTESATA